MADTYTVKRGDTLSEIAEAHKSQYGYTSTYEYTDYLAKINNIANKDYLYIGQVLKLTGTADTVKKNTTSKVKITAFGLQSDTDRTVFACWNFDKNNVDHYETDWQYATGDKNDAGNLIWFDGSDSTVTSKLSTYTAPNNATHVRFRAKPVSKTYKKNGKDVKYWTGSWCTRKKYNFDDNPPEAPQVPTVTIEQYTLKASVSNVAEGTESIKFQVVKDDKTVYQNGTAKVVTAAASYSCTVDAGSKYKVRCQATKNGEVSNWSEYSNNVETMPSAVTSITICRAASENSVYLEWPANSTAKTYDIEYSTKKEYLDGSDSNNRTTGIETNYYTKTGLETGQQYFFRVRAVNQQGESAWSEIASVVIGKKPAAPTTWSSTTTVITGEELILYWTHNSEDSSSETFAELSLTINGSTNTYTIKNTTNEDEKDKTSFCTINTSTGVLSWTEDSGVKEHSLGKVFVEGTKILWSVRTAGITNVYGDPSVQRTVDVYAPVTTEFRVTDADNNVIDTITSFPFYIYALGGPSTQVPIGYHLSVISNEVYETVDNVGNTKYVNAGEIIYSKYFDITTALNVEMSADSINLENDVSYTVSCTVTMNSGLSSDVKTEITVTWADQEYEPNAEIAIDLETLTAHIRPYCMDENEELIPDIYLSLYRREYDGSFTEIATGLNNLENTFVTDPHPALDYARYRVVATEKTTGAVSFYDVPGVPVGEKAVIIQWNEAWSSFDVSEEAETEQPAWSGSMLKLPYNIDVSDKHTTDVTLVSYIGRKHPVSYYGTQLGESASWKVEIDKSDEETLYALRRLSIWMGDVYVREPSGSGYWASISVSFSQTHRALTIPVTLDITRVEGGA